MLKTKYRPEIDGLKTLFIFVTTICADIKILGLNGSELNKIIKSNK